VELSAFDGDPRRRRSFDGDARRRSTHCHPKETVILEGKEVERPAGWEKVPAGCVKFNVIAPHIPFEVVFYGSLEPQLLNGVKNGLSPSRLRFVAAGSLQVVGGNAETTTEGEATASGELKIVGASSQELITAR
jgi:hypothetical protein